MSRMAITIFNVSRSDAGTYVLTVHNAAGSTSLSLTLEVYGKNVAFVVFAVEILCVPGGPTDHSCAKGGKRTSAGMVMSSFTD